MSFCSCLLVSDQILDGELIRYLLAVVASMFYEVLENIAHKGKAEMGEMRR